ncbi:MAG: hypothetical protein FJ096_13390 [Deltaproteobacteria bacterium]|nr:hypothetical protein [Deltaproteobacteria bacterium]
MTMSRRSFRLAIPFAACAVAVVVSAGGTGCGAEETPLLITTSASATATSTTSSGAGGGDAASAGKQLFEELLPTMVKECGSCHVTGTDTPFLGDPKAGKPDPYETITSWPDFVVKDPEKSYLLVHATSPDHKSAKPSAELKPALEAWLAEEAKSIADVEQEALPTVPPFKPILGGFNAVYLGSLGPAFEGMAVTFVAEELTPTSISLSDIEVHPTSKLGVKLVHPLFTVFEKGSIDGEPDPVDSFSNVTLELQPGTSGVLGPGMVVLTNWKEASRLSLGFEVATVIDPNGTLDPNASPCKAVETFTKNAAPALNACFGCHGGADAQAQGAIDMSDLMDAPEKTCGQVLNRVNPKSPAKSQIFVTTSPASQAAHPFKFGGSAAQYNTFKDAVTLWIQEEAK